MEWSDLIGNDFYPEEPAHDSISNIEHEDTIISLLDTTDTLYLISSYNNIKPIPH